MKISLIDPQEISIEDSLNFSEDLSGADLLAEILRNELTAQRVCNRRFLCNKVSTLVEPVQKTSVDYVSEVLAELETNGDVTRGPAGNIASSPLRAVSVGPGRHRLHGSVPARGLQHAFGGDRLFLGVNRLLVASNDGANISEKVEVIGGIVLTPERWAGLARTPFADVNWLDSLAPLLEQQKLPAGALDNGVNEGWQNYSTEERGKPHNQRWKKSGDSSGGRLWRGWHERGWYVFAWTNGDSPSRAPSLKMNSDQARRVMFALDREIDNPVPISIRKENQQIYFRIAGFLPLAEYRYLATLGEYNGKQGSYFCFTLPSDNWIEVARTLEIRLGIKSKQDKS